MGTYKIKTIEIECPWCHYKEDGFFCTTKGLINRNLQSFLTVFDTYQMQGILGEPTMIVGAYICCEKCLKVFHFDGFSNRLEDP